jgi:hypothetical protein
MDGRKHGRKEGRKEGYDGRKEGCNGRAVIRKEGRNVMPQ